MLKPESLKSNPAENYDDLKRQFFALKKLCESKMHQCSVYSKKLAEYDRETLIARNEALNSEREMNATLTAELEKANERVEFLRGKLTLLDNAVYNPVFPDDMAQRECRKIFDGELKDLINKFVLEQQELVIDAAIHLELIENSTHTCNLLREQLRKE